MKTKTNKKQKKMRLLTLFLTVLLLVGSLTGTGMTSVSAATSLETAKTALDQAQKEYDEVQEEVNLGSIGFFTWNGCEYNTDYFYSITKSALTDSTGTKITAYTNLGKSTDSTSLDNLEAAVNWIDECNSLREKHGLSDLLIMDEQMFAAAIHNNYVMNSGDLNHPDVFGYDENIAFWYSNPFDGWYDEEKSLYDSGSTSNVGHYLNIINSNYKTTGFAVGSNGLEVYTQDFDYTTSSSSGKVYTTDEYRTRIKEYRSYLNGLVSKAKTKLDSAQKTYDQALIDATKVTLSSTSVSLEKGNSKTITATVTGDTSQKVSWSSSNTSVATVSNGKITAVGKGTATITAKTGNGKSATCKVTVTVPAATSVSLSKSTLSLTVGSSSTITATVSPSNADQAVTWKSSNTSVATVSNGKITAVSAGSATITATTSNGKSSTCKVTVTKPAVTSVTLNKTSAQLWNGETVSLTATVAPTGADSTVTWKTSNSSVATVSGGKVTAKAKGTATITATSTNGKTAKCTVTVKGVKPTSVSLSKTTASVDIGSTVSLSATVKPSGADQSVTWTSSNTSVATVSNGMVKGVKAGTATIAAKTANGKIATCTVTVSYASATKVILNQTTLSLNKGSSFILTTTVSPSTANQNVSWKTSNSAVATVSGGKVTGVNAGTATITATSADGKALATCTVTVSTSSSSSGSSSSSIKPVYRLFNPSTGEHLYTTDANEYDTLYRKHGWGQEGIGWYAPSSGTAVYRLYQPGLDNHLYTTDTNEIKVLTSKYGWVKDNNGQPVFYSGGSIPIYRVYNAKVNGLHHLTTGRSEYEILALLGWQQEGVKLYAAKVGNTTSTTIFF